MHDEPSRKLMDNLCAEIATAMLNRNSWRDRWRVEVDGCVFKIDIRGYPKAGTERDRKRQKEIAEALAELETLTNGD
jgi:hypothetical protein